MDQNLVNVSNTLMKECHKELTEGKTFYYHGVPNKVADEYNDIVQY